METIKKLLASVPTTAWVIIAVVALFMFWWLSDDIGNWWSDRKSTKFDEAEKVWMAERDALVKQRDAAIQKAVEAETREQAKQLEADLIRQEAEKKGVNIKAAQDKIDQAMDQFAADKATIDKVVSGEISKLQLCQLQCTDSAALGYPCRVNYCDKFK